MRKSDDPISRAVAVDALERIFDRCEEIEAHLSDGDPDKTGYKMLPDYMTVWKYLRQLPFAQPEIIRCKDCKYQDENWRSVSVKWLPCMDVRTGSNWYCGSAERKKNSDG